MGFPTSLDKSAPADTNNPSAGPPFLPHRGRVGHHGEPGNIELPIIGGTA